MARLYVFFFLCCSSSATLYKGDKCSMQDGGEGTCMLIKECSTAVQLINTGVNPIICGFEGIDLIVCCKYDEEVGMANTTTTTNRVLGRTPGDKSKQKCKEYADYAYKKIEPPTLLLYPHFTKNLVCDIPRNRLVVGSTQTSRKEFPHMALVGYKPKDEEEYEEVIWQCGGSLISENFILTAAHCTVSRTISMCLRLSKNVKFNMYVRPACLQTERHIPYDLAIASGWGAVSYVGERSNELLQVVVEFYSVDKCNHTYKRFISPTGRLQDGIVDDLIICAGSTKAVRTICQGDAGGPLQVYHEETEEIKCMYDIIGVISFGISCGLLKDNPGLYTRVSSHIKWIEDTVWPT
ncbi:venom protease-like [Anoplophora glabripennis]|uniref:venom protease-like n=1 Tax=Anoplophora glabripennis TaxID=217634 RepID=UPI000C76A5A1|nr:venom protease-like [Anoplophora glabripennis]